MSTSADLKLQKMNEFVGVHATDIVLVLFLLVALILSAIAYGSLRTLGKNNSYDKENATVPTSYTNSKRTSLGLLIMVLIAMFVMFYELFKKHQGARALATVLIKDRIRSRY